MRQSLGPKEPKNRATRHEAPPAQDPTIYLAAWLFGVARIRWQPQIAFCSMSSSCFNLNSQVMLAPFRGASIALALVREPRFR
jgi:hypothetical protein